MKAKQLIFTALIGIFISISGNTIIAQEKRSDRNQGRRSGENNRTRVERQSTQERNYQSASNTKNNNSKHDKNNGKNYKHQKVEDHCHVGCTAPGHHSSAVHVHSNGYNHSKHSSHYVYLQRLPSPYYMSFVVGYDTFYHCQGRFYAYLPGRGYVEVELQLPTVRYTPSHCTVRGYNGNNYYYKGGYYYIPFEHGFYRVRDHSTEVVCRLRN